jgi:hypothetical protein
VDRFTDQKEYVSLDGDNATSVADDDDDDTAGLDQFKLPADDSDKEDNDDGNVCIDVIGLAQMIDDAYVLVG